MDGAERSKYTVKIADDSEAERQNGGFCGCGSVDPNLQTRLLQKRMGPEEQAAGSLSPGRLDRKSLVSRLTAYRVKEIFTWPLLKTLAMGQGLSLLICGTAVTCQYLVEWKVDTPMLQSFLNYALLFLTYTVALAFRKGDGNILQILRTKWWKYLLVGLSDVQANYAVVKAYQLTTLTSIQLLDCFVIPVLMVLSWMFLRTRYRAIHYVSVVVCLLGVGAMVGADLLAGREQGSTSNILLGDGLVLISATLYAVSNVCQEHVVKNQGRVEFLGMMGLFGTLISGTQMAILEHESVVKIPWNWQIVVLIAIYVSCMFLLYSCMPVVVRLTSATAVNLSLLTADLFSLFCGLFLFCYTFSALYIVSFVVITVGFVMFNAVPTFAPEGLARLDRTPAPSLSASLDNYFRQEVDVEKEGGGGGATNQLQWESQDHAGETSTKF
ncbi:solute carrier family 35 member F2-like isoform X2 [Brienomyrus brachyistius]|uniref:solute carrier family 35 member F2-like isoform X2 n=1 Tax=Brienomyrus brachyistius TaxID=42636 RepID=UPI0020B35366|nr:solute carrier family 35 member F2-like isoform X2 [Brienomyrus brachyistius]